MADSKLFMIPFGASGDRATIPETVAPSGAVSWPQGFGPDYERDPATDPMAKRVPRDETNEYLYQITNAIKFLQLYGVPEWFADDGLGSPVSYPLGARVRHESGGTPKIWASLIGANTSEPGLDPTKWAEIKGGGLITTRVFKTPGSFSYTPSPGTAFIEVEGCGGGGAGGGAPVTGGGLASAGAGGAAGAWGSVKLPAPATPVSITVGAAGVGVGGAAGLSGGNSSYGSVIFPGGPGGTEGDVTSAPRSSGATFASAPPSGVDYGSVGSGTYAGFILSASSAIAGAGGSGPYGAGGRATGVNAGGALPGVAGGGFGSGGGGAVAVGSGVANPGGNGTSGIIIIREYAFF